MSLEEIEFVFSEKTIRKINRYNIYHKIETKQVILIS
jgi:hypothetical protein